MENVRLKELIYELTKMNAESITPLTGGMMNQSYTFKSKEKEYVLYISTKQANEMVNRVLEKEHQQIVYDLGITSKNIHFDVEKGIKINEFISGNSLNNIESFDYQKVADLFKKLHSSKTLSKENYNPFDRFINIYEKEAKEFINTPSEKYLLLRNYLFQYEAELRNRPVVLSHNDAQRSNIVKDNNDNYFFIDFEFMANNDEIYDIACFGNGKVSEGRKLLDYYFNGSPTEEDIKYYYLWRIFVSLQWYNVAIVKHYRGEGKTHGFNFLDVANFFLDNAMEAYASLLK